MKYFARFAVLGAALVLAAPLASATTLLYGHINTSGAADFNYAPATLMVDGSGHAVLNLQNPASPVPTIGAVTGPAAYGTLAAFFGTPMGTGITVTDYSFDTADLAWGPVKIMSLANGTDVITFFATSEMAFTASNPSTEGAVTLLGYLSETGPSYSSITYGAVLDIAANGIGNNFTEDLSAQAPEPSSLVLLGSGLVSAGGMLVRRRKVTV